MYYIVIYIYIDEVTRLMGTACTVLVSTFIYEVTRLMGTACSMIKMSVFIAIIINFNNILNLGVRNGGRLLGMGHYASYGLYD